MRKIKNFLLLVFIVSNTLVVLLPFAVFLSRNIEIFDFTVEFSGMFLPSMYLTLLLSILWFEKTLLAVVYSAIALIPIVGCCFVKKHPWIYRILVLIPMLLAVYMTLDGYNGQRIVLDFTYLGLAMIIDILSMLDGSRKENKLY